MARNFHKLEVWQLSYALVLELYRVTESFPESEVNNLISQIRRAAVSVPLNIAEGSARYTKRSYLQFLNYAYGSVRELEVLLLLCKDLKYVNEFDFKLLYENIDKISRKLFVFIKKVNKDKYYD
ncbi:MAG TPA: four helix bundle protein [Candidatus Nanoarchaeia archaeon]|nr:four helix bundle protein [Candidatus Nanoarchaeia archaeon]